MLVQSGKLFLTTILSVVVLFGCTQGGQNSGNLEQLRREVLDSACDEDIRKNLENVINKQMKLLSEEQMRRSLQNMKKNMRC